MTDKTEVAEFVFDKLEGYMSAAQSVIDTYGGDAAELGLMALRIEAASEVLFPSIIMLFLLVNSSKIVGFVKNQFAKSRAITNYQHEEDEKKREALRRQYMRSDEVWFGVLAFMSVGACFITFSICFIAILDIWAWVGMFYPEAYAVHLFLLK